MLLLGNWRPPGVTSPTAPVEYHHVLTQPLLAVKRAALRPPAPIRHTAPQAPSHLPRGATHGPSSAEPPTSRGHTVVTNRQREHFPQRVALSVPIFDQRSSGMCPASIARSRAVCCILPICCVSTLFPVVKARPPCRSRRVCPPIQAHKHAPIGRERQIGTQHRQIDKIER